MLFCKIYWGLCFFSPLSFLLGDCFFCLGFCFVIRARAWPGLQGWPRAWLVIGYVAYFIDTYIYFYLLVYLLTALSFMQAQVVVVVVAAQKMISDRIGAGKDPKT